MGFAERHNKVNRTFDIDISKHDWKTLEQLYIEKPNAIYPLKGFFVKEYKKGRRSWESAVMISDSFCCYAPGFMTDDFKDMTAEDIDDIKKGCVGFKVVERICKIINDDEENIYYSIEWYDFK